MGKHKYDVIIVGGGPAGASAAHTLAGHGMNVCIVDKAVFPRDKLCGGLLTERSRKVFDTVFNTSWQPAVEGVSHGMRFFYHERLLNEVKDYTKLTWARRTRFDAHLVELAKNAGARLRQGVRVKAVEPDTCTVALADGVRIEADYLIGADGVNSIVAQSLFGRAFDKNTIAFGLEMEAPLGGQLQDIADPEIYFGVVKWGYGWVFPKRETLTIGVAGLWKKNPDIKNAFQRFVGHRCHEIPRAKIKGQYIPFGDYRRMPGRDNILLCGDAAGVVEPITGEGIAYAMQSGYLAARAIIESAARRQPAAACQHYAAGYASIAGSLRWANALRYLIFPKWSESLFATLLPKTQSVPRKHLDLMAAELDYDEYAQFLIKKTGGFLFHSVIRRSSGQRRKALK
jgi:geranylgeranyl reductase family protein